MQDQYNPFKKIDAASRLHGKSGQNGQPYQTPMTPPRQLRPASQQSADPYAGDGFQQNALYQDPYAGYTSNEDTNPYARPEQTRTFAAAGSYTPVYIHLDQGADPFFAPDSRSSYAPPSPMQGAPYSEYPGQAYDSYPGQQWQTQETADEWDALGPIDPFSGEYTSQQMMPQSGSYAPQYYNQPEAAGYSSEYPPQVFPTDTYTTQPFIQNVPDAAPEYRQPNASPYQTAPGTVNPEQDAFSAVLDGDPQPDRNSGSAPSEPVQVERPRKETGETTPKKKIKKSGKTGKAQNSDPDEAEKKKIPYGQIFGWFMISAFSVLLVFLCLRIWLEVDGSAKQPDILSEYADHVVLLPPGQTFAPTALPAGYQPRVTPAPEKAENKNGSKGDKNNAQESENAEEISESPTPAQRSVDRFYPQNPMRNTMPEVIEMREENTDIVGHLIIEGLVDEPVMKRNNTFYLNHSKYGSTSPYGCVFVDDSCNFNLPPENLILRGSSNVDGKVFAPLKQFAESDREFVREHLTLTLTTPYETCRYILMSVMIAGNDPSASNYFNFAGYPSFVTDSDMKDYLQKFFSHSLYTTNVDVLPQDRLLTLATVDSSGDNLVLLYRIIRDNELQ